MSTWFKQVANNSLSYLNAQIEPLRHRQKYGKTSEEIIDEIQSELQITISREKDVERKIETEEQHRKKIRSKHQELNFRVQNLDENRQFLFKQTADYECKLEKQAQTQKKLLMAMDTLNTQLVDLDNIKLRSAVLNLKGATELEHGTRQKLPKLQQTRQQVEEQLKSIGVQHMQCSNSIEELTHKRESLRTHLNDVQQQHQRLTQKRDSLRTQLNHEQERLTANNGNELVEVHATKDDDDDSNNHPHEQKHATENDADKETSEMITIFENESQSSLSSPVSSLPDAPSPSMQSLYGAHKALNEEIASTAALIDKLHRELNACEKRIETEHVQLGKLLLHKVTADKEVQRMRDMIQLQQETLSSIEQSVHEYSGKQQQCLQQKANAMTKLESYRHTLGAVKQEMSKYRDDIQAIREASNSLSQKKFDLANKLKRIIDKENEVEEELKILHRNRMSLRSRKAQLVKQALSLQEQSQDANVKYATQTAAVMRCDCDPQLLSKKQKQKQHKLNKEQPQQQKQQSAVSGQFTVSKEFVQFACDTDSRFDLKHEMIDVSHSSLTNYSSTTQHPMLLLYLVQGVAYHGGHRYLATAQCNHEAIDNCYKLQIQSVADKNMLLLMHNLLLAKQDLMDKVHSLRAQQNTELLDKVHKKHSSIFSIHDIEIEDEFYCHCTSGYQLRQIISLCPSRTHISKWKLFYSTAVHGISMNTLYANCETVAESLLVIKDTSNHIFGAFIDVEWIAATDYRGTMDCFVFQLVDNDGDDDNAERKEEDNANNENKTKAIVYRASGQKAYFIRNDMESITIGAGECPAIYIDADLNIGRSTSCTTFNSPCLVPNTPFQITTLEIWGCFL